MPRTVGVQPTSYVLNIVITGGTASRGNTVKVRNRRTGEYNGGVSDNNTANVNLANLSTTGDTSGTLSGFNNGDEIDIEVSGGSFGGTTHTINTLANPGGARISIATTDVTSTNTPGADA